MSAEDDDVDIERVRQQLQSELGYDASSFSDDVLRAILSDLTIAAEGPPQTGGAEPLAFPTAVGVDFVPHVPAGASARPGDYAGGLDEAHLSGRARKPHTPRRTPDRPQTARARPATASEVPLRSARGVHSDGRPPASSPAAPSSAPRPGTARSARSAPRTPPSASRLAPSGSTMGFIAPQKSTPGRVKSDPVSMRQQQMREWSNNAFLRSRQSTTPRHAPITTTHATTESYRVHHDRVARAAQYQVPTEKRRDRVVWETRERLRRDHVPHQTKFSRPRVPNTYVPPTSKARADLRWQVRTELAVVY